MKKYLVLLVLFVPLLVFGANTPQVTNITNSSRLYRMGINLTAGTSYVFRTYGAISSIDTVLYLLNNSNSQVAYNDDCGNNCLSPQTSLNSTISFTPSTTGYYYVVMRNYYSGTVGAVANLKVFTNGSSGPMMTGLPLGGTRTSIQPWDAYSQTTPIVAWRQLDFYFFNADRETTGGATANDTVMYLMSSSSITNYDDDSGAGNTSKITKTSGSCSTGCYVLGGAFPFTYSDESEGNAKLIVDVDTRFGDTDYDGLSNGLEGILGTSSLPLGGGDTDQDGLNDFLETVGIGGMPLPWDGADPLIKDIFIEADYMPTPSNLSPRRYVNYLPSAISYFSNVDGLDFIGNIKYSFMHHGNTRIHFEIDDQIPYYQYMGCSSNKHPEILATDLKSSHFTAAREGVYRYAVFGDHVDDPFNNDDNAIKGMSCENIATILIAPQEADDHHGTYITLFVHELGHQLGLSHNGNEDVGSIMSCGIEDSVIHRSIMNYGFAGAGFVPGNKIIGPVGVPIDNPEDSLWRYATDTAVTTQYNLYSSCEPGYPYLTIDWNAGDDDYPGCVENYQYSIKKECLENPSPTCDCTGNEYEILDYSSGGLELAMAFLEENGNSESQPVIGIAGNIISEDQNEARELSRKYTKLKELSKEEIKNIRHKNKKLISEKVKNRYKEKLIEKLRKNHTVKEGREYEIRDGKIIFHQSLGYQSFDED